MLQQSVTECYRVLQSVTERYDFLQSTKEYYRVLQIIAEYYRLLQSITEYCRVLRSIAEYYLGQQRQHHVRAGVVSQPAVLRLVRVENNRNVDKIFFLRSSNLVRVGPSLEVDPAVRIRRERLRVLGRVP